MTAEDAPAREMYLVDFSRHAGEMRDITSPYVRSLAICFAAAL